MTELREVKRVKGLLHTFTEHCGKKKVRFDNIEIF